MAPRWGVSTGVPAVLLLCYIPSSVAIRKPDVCGLQSQPSVTLTKDPISGVFQVEEGNTRNETNNNRIRKLQGARSTDAWSLEDIDRKLQSDEVSITVRECYCGSDATINVTNTSQLDPTIARNFTTWYCPYDRVICEISPSRSPRCYEASVSEFIGNLWPVVIFWFALFAIALFFTNIGRFARHYVQHALLWIKCYNRQPGERHSLLNRQLDQLMTRQPGYVARLARAYRRRQTDMRRLQQSDAGFELQNQHGRIRTPIINRFQPETETAAPSLPPPFPSATAVARSADAPYPTSLALRTRLYQSPSRVDEENVCIICLGSILDGDRVGVLPCSHDFHVLCLKVWLKRKNQCPLCQKQTVASERFDSEDSNEDQAT